MERYLEQLADMRRRELITDARPARADGTGADCTRADHARDPLRGAPRARMMWWIAADRLRRAARGSRPVTTTVPATTTETTRDGAR
jgi:hypothetical protein